MQQNQTTIFLCQACGHQFHSALALVSRQPTCPRCRTWGRIVGPGGAPVAPTAVAPAPAPVPGQRRAPLAPLRSRQAAQGKSAEAVQVHAGVAYGSKGNGKAIVTTAIVLGIGVASIVVLYLIVSTLASGRKDDAIQRKEVVQDPRDFERAIDESVARVRKLLQNVPNAELHETADFSTVLDLIQQSGGSTPAWSEPPRPGQPFKTAAFVLEGKHENTGQPDGGFVMLLYYRTAAEVESASREINSQISGSTQNFSLTVNKEIWYVAYSGNPFGGRIFDALKAARDLGKPHSLRQFTDRVGSTYKGQDTKG